LPFNLQWSATQMLLGAIRTQGFDALIDKLGGAPLLRELEQAHAEYGQALGITELSDEQAAAPRVRDALTEPATSMRAYAVAVVGIAGNGDDHAAQQRVDRLL